MSRPVLADVELNRLKRAAGHVTPAGESPAPASNPHYRVGRSQKSAVTVFWFPPVKEQLRILGAKQKRTIQAQLTEAINDYFAKHGVPEIAE